LFNFFFELTEFNRYEYQLATHLRLVFRCNHTDLALSKVACNSQWRRLT